MIQPAGVVRVSKQEYKEQVARLREELLEAQVRLQEQKTRVILLFAGVDGAGKSESCNLLSEWLDPRWIVTLAYEEPTQEESERPRFWRYWRDLPARGQIGTFLSAWYHDPLLNRVYGRTDVDELNEQLDQIRAFETMLADDGALVMKFWMHLDKESQKTRLEALEKDPHQKWRVRPSDWKNWRRYDDFIAAAQRLIQRTGTPECPWTVIDGSDPYSYGLQVGRTLLKGIKLHLSSIQQAADGEDAEHEQWLSGGPALLSAVDLDRSLSKAKYKDELKEAQSRLHSLQHEARILGISTILAFEGWDAAGKGGAIRRITGGLDARSYRVIRIAAPTDEEQAHHYLWRFWRHLPRAGRVTLFDRSWYGRVLVERVEGFATIGHWRRAYSEINEFEKELVQDGVVLRKFWFHISKDEQKRRFEARAKIPFKRWKLTDEDWRNRKKWDAYEDAANDMLRLTHTDAAPWVIVESNDKRYARIKTIQAVCEAVEERIAQVAARKGPT